MPERALDQNRVPSSERAQAVIREIINRLINYERYHELRQRARRPEDQAIFEKSISAIVSDVIVWHILSPGDWLYVSLSHRNLRQQNRYQPFNFGSTLSHNLKVLNAREMGFIEKELGHRVVIEEGFDRRIVRRRTSIRAGVLLRRWIEEQGLRLDEFGYSDDEEIIIKKADKKWHGDKGEWLEYEDTDQTVRWRRELRAINRWLQASDIAYVGHERVNSSDRRLRRVFNNNSFEQGGRLFGGFWQGLNKADRRRNIQINNEAVVELDYGQTALRLLYGLVGQDLPQGDLYAVPGYEEGQYRDGIKLVINSALFAEAKQNRMPQGGRAYFPPRVRYADVLSAVERYHNKVADKFFAGVGMHLMFRESEVLLGVLRGAMEQHVPVLPIHDAVLVQNSKVPTIDPLMRDMFRRLGGTEPEVTIKR
jgi:hypothetical protein